MTDYQQTYWDHIGEGSLWLQFCVHCQRYVFYPRRHCPHCLSENLEWRQSSGQGKVHSYTAVRVSALPEFKDLVPYVYALVDLVEGVRIPTNIIGCAVDQVSTDMPVILTTIKREGRALPVFKPFTKQN